MISRIIRRANNGYFRVLTENNHIVCLYDANDNLRIGDFVETSGLQYDWKKDDDYVLFYSIVNSNEIDDELKNKYVHFLIDCDDCQFRINQLMAGCNNCQPKSNRNGGNISD